MHSEENYLNNLLNSIMGPETIDSVKEAYLDYVVEDGLQRT